MTAKLLRLACIASIVLLVSCQSPGNEHKEDTKGSQFMLLPEAETHIDFINTLNEGPNTNVLLYEYFYNGGGVAVGDINNDGLQDIYFSSNLNDGKLYLNKGNLLFEDITVQAGVLVRSGPWKTGVTMADVNGDGKLDLYICYSGKMPAAKRANQLFINQGSDKNGMPSFLEMAKDYGIADSGYSTQAYFFDYDRDQDVDMLLLNHNPENLPVLDEAATSAILAARDANIGIKLYRNDDNHFTDVSAQAGINGSALTYGLGAGISDIDQDGWQDIYVSNDYGVPDYLYMNNKNGTFRDRLQSSVGHISHFSMGNNVADVNNDGLPDIFTLDMLPEDNRRQKLLFAPDNYEKFDLSLRSGFYFQYMRNMLHINNGDGTFSEIGQLAGVSNTDWSWAPLFADYDNDGWKDLYVTNGYLRDFTNMDFMKYMNDYIQSKGRLQKEEVLKLVSEMPSSNVANYMYKNMNGFVFNDVGKRWGLATSANSNGAAYADLDNDGDLDLIVNNINQPAFIYRNNNTDKNHWLSIKLEGSARNTQGIGAKISIYNSGKQQYLEQMPARGYQSSVSPVLHFGLGQDSLIDSLCITWLSGRRETMKNIAANQVLTLQEAKAVQTGHHIMTAPTLFEEVKPPVNYTYAASNINDFKRQPLLVNPLSFSGPCLAKADINGDGLEDLFAGGGSGQPGSIYLQQKNGQFVQQPQPAFEQDKLCEDADAVFADVNKDGFTDLYVASGGYHNYQPGDNTLQDRLYLNDGKGHFSKAVDALPGMKVSKSCVRAADINGDGFIDFFAGGRVVPGNYPLAPQSFLLLNDGKGHFTDKLSEICAPLVTAGMITDAAWVDLNNDQQQDLVVVGEWMPVSVFINHNGKLENKTKDYFDKEYSGFWNRLVTGDFNKDGKTDLIIGNLGLNTQCKASDKEPAEMFYKDFDDNGSIDPMLCFYIQGKSYPYVTRDELLDQMSMMRARYTDYKSYADLTLNEIFSAEEMKDVRHLSANHLQTTYFERAADGKFREKQLPLPAQYAPVYSITVLDFDKDGNDDLLLCGNINHARLRFGKYDANYGMLFKGDGKGNFSYISQQRSGFSIRGDVRAVLSVNNHLLFGINGQVLKSYKLR